MDLQLKEKLFLVGGATSGLGRAISELLINEGAKVIAIARTEANLLELQNSNEGLEIVVGDITEEEVLKKVLIKIGDRPLTGAIINSGGPPALAALDTKLSDWDSAYNTVLRWKIAMTQALLPNMMKQNYGRLLYIESVSVKQAVENLVLSNSMRLAVVGYVKTLSQEIGNSGVTMNILAPGYHATQRMEDLFKKNSTLLSPYSAYISGQTISVDGGLVKGTMG